MVLTLYYTSMSQELSTYGQSRTLRDEDDDEDEDEDEEGD